jgi:hypothetical protein
MTDDELDRVVAACVERIGQDTESYVARAVLAYAARGVPANRLVLCRQRTPDGERVWLEPKESTAP